MKWRRVLVGLASTVCAALAVETIAAGPAMAGAEPASSTLSRWSGTVAAGQATTTHLQVSDPDGGAVTGDPQLIFGHEQGYSLDVAVLATVFGVPAGTVTITDATASGTITLCSSTLDRTGEAGFCPLGPSTLPAGGNQLTATYAGDGVYAPSTTQRTITVLAVQPTTTTLTLSAPSVPFGSEQTETLTATVTPAASGTPAGTVTVTTGTTPLCTISLAGGTGTCSPPSGTLLRPGSYPLTAAYSGDATDLASSDTSKTLVVAKEPTVTTLTLSADTIAFGSEDAELFTAGVDPAVGGTPAGNVTVKVGVVGVCTLPLAANAGCSLKPSQLKVGTYQITATYGGDSTFAASTSPPQTLTVVDL